MWVLATETFREKDVYQLAQQLGPAITKNELGLGIHHFDDAGVVHHHHGGRCGFHHLAKAHICPFNIPNVILHDRPLLNQQKLV